MFVADDLAAWLVGLLAEAGRKRLARLVLGSDLERALGQAASAAVLLAASELCPDNDERRDEIAAIINHVFSVPAPSAPMGEQMTMLETLQAGVARQLAPLNDPSLTDVGQSSASLLEIEVAALTKVLTRHLVREIIIRGAQGGSLEPLSSQLNHDVSHLQGRRLEAALMALVSEIQKSSPQVHMSEAAAPDVFMASPSLVGMIPPLADCHQYRRAERDLDIVVRGKEEKARCFVLCGLGGVGKTQVAAALAHRMWEHQELDLLIWVSATSRDNVMRAYEEAGEKIFGATTAPREESAAPLLAALAEAKSLRWLIIVDNLNDPADLNGLWPPNTSQGLTIVTTRRRDSALSGRGRKVIDVDVFTAEESANYLRERLSAHKRLLTEADQLASDLGNLPLALAQATAFILDLALDCASYRARLHSRRHRLADLLPAPESLPDEHRATVTATWSISIERADSLRPVGLARPMLEVVAGSYDHDNVGGYIRNGTFWSPILTSSYVRDYLSTLLHRDISYEEARDALYCLHRFSLVSLDQPEYSGYPYVWTHPLLRRVIRDSFTPEKATRVKGVVGEACLNYYIVSMI